MSLTMHTATVPTCVRALNSLAAILGKATAYTEARKIDPKVFTRHPTVSRYVPAVDANPHRE